MKSTVVLVLLLACAGAEVFLLRRLKDAWTELVCVYNGPQSASPALAWILPNMHQPVNITYHRWTTSRKGKVTFEMHPGYWTKKSSLHIATPNVLPPAMDERWNSFPDVWTFAGEKLKYAKRFSTDRLHVSVLARGPTNLILSTGPDPNSPSYKITFDVRLHAGKHYSQLSKCIDGCSVIAESWKDQAMLKHGSSWVTLTISLSYSDMGLKLQISDNSFNSTTFGWDDTSPIKDIKYVSLYSEETSIRWRLHDYEVWLPKTNQKVLVINSNLTGAFVSCVRFLYFLQPNFGAATITVGSSNHSLNLQTSQTWRPMRLEFSMTAPTDQVMISLPDYAASGTNVFAISDIQACGDNEYSTSKLKVLDGRQIKDAKCVEMTSAEFTVAHEHTLADKPSIHECMTGNTFSVSCNITCRSAVDYSCQNMTVCDSTSCSCIGDYVPTESWSTTCRNTRSMPTLSTTRPSMARTTSAGRELDGQVTASTSSTTGDFGTNSDDIFLGTDIYPWLRKHVTWLVVILILLLLLVAILLLVYCLRRRRTKSEIINRL